MKIEIDAKDVKEVLFRAKKTTTLTGRKILYTVEVATEWESWSNSHVVFKTTDYQEALSQYQLLVGELQS